MDELDLINRIIQVKNLKENCFKYLEDSSSELLTHKIILSIAKLSSEKMGPVKLAEIAKDVYNIDNKSKQDLIRLTLEKSILKCGIVEKLRYASNDVRYSLAAYRFQKVKGIDSFRGEKTEPIGEIIEIPKKTWPIGDEFFILLSKKHAYNQVLKKINSDFDNVLLARGKYEDLIRQYTENLSQITNKLNLKFQGLEDLVI